MCKYCQQLSIGRQKESLDNKNARDTAECMRVFARHGRTLGGAIAYAKHIFEASGGTIRFMSGHRAKGLEFDSVYHLNSEDIRPEVKNKTSTT